MVLNSTEIELEHGLYLSSDLAYNPSHEAPRSGVNPVVGQRTALSRKFATTAKPLNIAKVLVHGCCCYAVGV